jgi:hypothetical protein
MKRNNFNESKLMTITGRTIFEIDLDYLKKYPKATPLIDVSHAFGYEKLFEIYNESKGREIVFSNGKGDDQITYYFKD